MTSVQAKAYSAAYYRVVSALIERNPEPPFFVTEWTDPRIGEGYARIPMSSRTFSPKNPNYIGQDFPEYRFLPWTNRVDPYAVKVAEIYTTSLLARARYEEEHGRPDEGSRYGTYALSFDPGFAEEDVPDFRCTSRISSRKCSATMKTCAGECADFRIARGLLGREPERVPSR